jgi:hypothetical protein
MCCTEEHPPVLLDLRAIYRMRRQLLVHGRKTIEFLPRFGAVRARRLSFSAS